MVVALRPNINDQPRVYLRTASSILELKIKKEKKINKAKKERKKNCYDKEEYVYRGKK